MVYSASYDLAKKIPTKLTGGEGGWGFSEAGPRTIIGMIMGLNVRFAKKSLRGNL